MNLVESIQAELKPLSGSKMDLGTLKNEFKSIYKKVFTLVSPDVRYEDLIEASLKRDWIKRVGNQFEIV